MEDTVDFPVAIEPVNPRNSMAMQWLIYSLLDYQEKSVIEELMKEDKDEIEWRFKKT